MKIKTRVGLGAMLIAILFAQMGIIIVPAIFGIIGFLFLVWED